MDAIIIPTPRLTQQQQAWLLRGCQDFLREMLADPELLHGLNRDPDRTA